MKIDPFKKKKNFNQDILPIKWQIFQIIIP